MKFALPLPFVPGKDLNRIQAKRGCFSGLYKMYALCSGSAVFTVKDATSLKDH